jgi:hypothetical protein
MKKVVAGGGRVYEERNLEIIIPNVGEWYRYSLKEEKLLIFTERWGVAHSHNDKGVNKAVTVTTYNLEPAMPH